MHPDCAHLLVFPCLPPPLWPSPQNKTNKKQKQTKKNKYILCCPYLHWSMVKSLVVSPPREDEPCFTTRSHQLRRSLPGQDGTSSCTTTGFKWQLQPQACTWASVVTQATDINKALGLIKITDPHHNFQQSHWPHALTWPQVVYTCHSHQHGTPR